MSSLRIKFLCCSADGRSLYGVSGLKNIVIINLETTEEVGLLFENDDIIHVCINHRGDKLLTNTSTHSPVYIISNSGTASMEP